MKSEIFFILFAEKTRNKAAQNLPNVNLSRKRSDWQYCTNKSLYFRLNWQKTLYNVDFVLYNDTKTYKKDGDTLCFANKKTRWPEKPAGGDEKCRKRRYDGTNIVPTVYQTARDKSMSEREILIKARADALRDVGVLLQLAAEKPPQTVQESDSIICALRDLFNLRFAELEHSMERGRAE